MDHSDSERGNLLCSLHGLSFPINSKTFFNMHHPTEKVANTMTFVIPVMEQWMEGQITQWFHHEGLI